MRSNGERCAATNTAMQVRILRLYRVHSPSMCEGIHFHSWDKNTSNSTQGHKTDKNCCKNTNESGKKA